MYVKAPSKAENCMNTPRLVAWDVQEDLLEIFAG